jgi:hypothetical protein
MNRKEMGAFFSLNRSVNAGKTPRRSLLDRVGRALGLPTSSPAMMGIEKLEERNLLEGSFATAIAVTLDGAGRGSSAGLINPTDPATDDDFYSFVAPTSDFVAVLADTANEAVRSDLNTRITVFGSQSFTDIVAQGTSNGLLTTGVQRDGWGGFVAEAGRTYYVRVSSDYPTNAPNLTANNTYTLRVRAQSSSFEMTEDTGIGRELGSPPPGNPLPPLRPVLGSLTLRQDEVFYRYVVPADTAFDSLVTVNAQHTRYAPPPLPNSNIPNRLDTRLEIYDGTGALITADSDAGRLNDAFSTFRARPGDTFFIRVRSDEVRSRQPATPAFDVTLATGQFFLVLDARPTVATLNPVQRTFATDAAFTGFGAPTVPANPALPNPTFQSALWSFVSQGDGLTFVTITPTGLAPVTDPAVRIFDEQGALVAFNDNAAGLSAELQVRLVGGNRYFVVADGFEVNSAVQYIIAIEANHTFDQTQPIDDHVNPVFPADDATPEEIEDARRQWELATGLTWSAPFPTLDANQNVVKDRGLRVTANGTGRLHGVGDRDLFQFTPQTDMLMEYDGDNDDAGLSIFMGGRFEVGDPGSPWPTTSRNLTNWDAADYWYTGAQFFDPDFNVTYGFNDNANTVDTAGPEIYALLDYDPGAPDTAAIPAGMSRRWLVVGGDFDLIVPSPFGPVTISNLAVWFQDFDTGQWAWGDLGGADGPVRALASYLPDETIQDRLDPGTPVPTNRPLINGQAIEQLAIGGEFTEIGGVAASNLATFDLFNGFVQLGAGLNGPVFALTSYNPPDPGDERAWAEAQPGPPPDPELPFVRNPDDIGNSLIIGGEFDFIATVFAGATPVGAPARNIALWDGLELRGVTSGRTDAILGDPGDPAGDPFGGDEFNPLEVNGPVRALTVFDPPDPDFDGPEPDPEPVLVVGGEFTNVSGLAVGNIFAWGFVDTDQDPEVDTYSPSLLLFDFFGGVGGNGVFALTTWNPPELNGADNVDTRVLVIGGDFNFNGINNIVAFDGFGFGWFNASEGTDLPVRTLATAIDEQEPGIAVNLRESAPVPQEVLYVGGDFTEVSNGPAAPPVAASRVTQFSAVRGLQADFFTFSRMNGGVGNADPDAAPQASVFALSTFDDGNPLEWDRHDRRQTRLAISVSPEAGSFANMRVRVFDSNFNVVYGFDRDGSESIAPPFPDPAGMIDYSLSGLPLPTQNFEGIKVWAGETYYIEISNVGGNTNEEDQITPRGGTGRYSFSVTADGLAVDLNADGLRDDTNASIREEPNEGSFAQAIRITTALATGDGDNLVNSATPPPPLNGNVIRTEKIRPSTEAPRTSPPGRFTLASDLGNIGSIDDTDLYTFRAEFTGFAEVRLQTSGLADQFGELLTVTPSEFRGEVKTYNGRFDSALRVFSNDFEQIGYNDENSAVDGEFEIVTISGVQARFYKRDARLVFPVIAGNNYFIQVESGQRFTSATAGEALTENRVENIARETEIRQTIGSYRLIVRQMPQAFTDIENGVTVTDDYPDAVEQGGGALTAGSRAIATPIPFSVNGPTNGTASLTGVIQNTPFKPADNDIFTFTTPGSGTLAIRLNRAPGSALNADLFIYNAAGEFIEQALPLGNGTLSLTASSIRPGQRFFLVVATSGGSEGAYGLTLSGIPFADDHASLAKWTDASDVTLLDFQGQGEASGNIDFAGDTDIFRLEADSFLSKTVTVTSLDPTLDPVVTIYEVSEDLSGNPIFLRVGFNDNFQQGNTAARVTFSVNPGRVKEPGTPAERPYPYYYIVVEGADPLADVGRYNVSISFNPTDDHPDGAPTAEPPVTVDTSQFSLATNIVIDAQTGLGTQVGEIERSTDTDLFRFSSPASGLSTITVTRPSDSTLRYRVLIVDATGTVLASALSTDDVTVLPISVTTTLARNASIFVVVTGFDDEASPNINGTATGSYLVTIQAPPIDDHANAGEFTLASVVPLNSTTGGGRIGGTAANDPTNPRLSYAGDTDLFTFSSLLGGDYSVTITPFNTISLGNLTVRLTLFNATGTVISTIASSAPGANVSLTLTALARGVQYFALVETVGTGSPTGEYAIVVQGPGQDGGDGPDGSEVDFNNPSIVTLDTRTGDGFVNDTINPAQDRDLFTFTTRAAGRVFVQVVTPNGSLLAASVRVLNAANEQPASTVVFDSDGVPGAVANATFVSGANTQYWVIVDGLGESTGSYTIRINTQPVTNFLYYPEGYANDNIAQFVSIVNPNSVDATYNVVLRYEFGTTFETVIASQTIKANTRGGVTLVDRASFIAAGVLKDVPYSIIIESDQPLGATLAHYDFGTSLGDAFTEKTSDRWQFARVERNPGDVLDFAVIHNPNNFDIVVTYTAIAPDGTTTSVDRTVGAGRRGGLAINDVAEFPRGIFSLTVTSRAAAQSNQSAFIGIVASLSHYDLRRDGAFGVLGQVGTGSQQGVITNFAQGPSVTSDITFFNPGDTTASVTLTGTYIRASLPQFNRVFNITPRSQVSFAGNALGLSPDQPVGLRYTSNINIAVQASQFQLADAEATTPAVDAAQRWIFGDAFLDPAFAGTRLYETLYISNPTNVATTVTISLKFFNGVDENVPVTDPNYALRNRSFTVTVGARGFAEIKLHERPEIVNDRTGPTWFSVDASSAVPILMSMTHYDLFQGGGWATNGVPVGLTNPIQSI